MPDLLHEKAGKTYIITLNRIEKNNAFDDQILAELLQLLNEAEASEEIRAIVLKANGKHFSAGADLAWMKQMAHFSEQENEEDAMTLAQVMHALHASSKPTIAMVHGCAYGGGAGLAAACDIAIAADNARFCFSEVKLGLIPAVISPYVVNAIGARNAAWLFTTAQVIEAKRALELQLVQHCLPEAQLLDFTLNCAEQISKLAPKAVRDSKRLAYSVQNQAITPELIRKTASLIAKKRVSEEGQKGLQAFLNKTTPVWDE